MSRNYHFFGNGTQETILSIDHDVDGNGHSAFNFMQCSAVVDATIITFADLTFNGEYIDSSIGSLFASKNNKIITFENVYIENFNSQNSLFNIMDNYNNRSIFYQTSTVILNQILLEGIQSPIKPLIQFEYLGLAQVVNISLVNQNNGHDDDDDDDYRHIYALVRCYSVDSVSISNIFTQDVRYRFNFFLFLLQNNNIEIDTIYLDFNRAFNDAIDTINFNTMFLLSTNNYTKFNHVTIRGYNRDCSEMLFFDVYSCAIMHFADIEISGFIGVASLFHFEYGSFNVININMTDLYISHLQASNTNNNLALIEITNTNVRIVIENSEFNDNNDFSSVIACRAGAECDIFIKNTFFTDNFGNLELNNGSCINNVNGIFIETGAVANVTLVDVLGQADFSATSGSDPINGLIVFENDTKININLTNANFFWYIVTDDSPTRMYYDCVRLSRLYHFWRIFAKLWLSSQPSVLIVLNLMVVVFSNQLFVFVGIVGGLCAVKSVCMKFVGLIT